MIDHTLLKPEATRRADHATMRRGKAVWLCLRLCQSDPRQLCAQRLQGSPVKVCTVVGFPLGATLPEVKAFETQQAIDAGATEIDMVINIGALKSQDDDLVARDIAAVVHTAHAAARWSKSSSKRRC